MKAQFIKKGDLIIFDDKHKLFCGDSTLKDSYRFLDNKAVMTFTSPPYNVGQNNYGNGGVGGQKYLTKESDIKSDIDYFNMLNDSSKNAMENSEYLFLNISHLSGNKQSLIEFNYEQRFNYVDTMLWVKNTTLPAIEPRVLNSDYEYIYIYRENNYKNENNTRKIKIGNDFRGNLSNVIRMDRNTRNEYAQIHSAMFPIELPMEIISSFTNENDLIIDNFSGLGTTLMACILLKRQYYGIELEPYYVEQTIKRFLEYNMASPANIKVYRNDKIIEFNEFKHLIDGGKLDIFDFI